MPSPVMHIIMNSAMEDAAFYRGSAKGTVCGVFPNQNAADFMIRAFGSHLGIEPTVETPLEKGYVEVTWPPAVLEGHLRISEITLHADKATALEALEKDRATLPARR